MNKRIVVGLLAALLIAVLPRATALADRGISLPVPPKELAVEWTADFDRDGDVDLDDFGILRANFGVKELDVVWDGVIDGRDIIATVQAMGDGDLTFDYNWDGVVDRLDVLKVLENYGRRSTNLSRTRDHDNITDIVDFSLFRMQYAFHVL